MGRYGMRGVTLVSGVGTRQTSFGAVGGAAYPD